MTICTVGSYIKKLNIYGGPIMKAKILLIGCLLTALAGADVRAAVIVSDDITGTNPNTSNPYTAGMTSDYFSSLTASGIGRGTGISGVNANDTYRANGFATGATLNTSNNDYYTFTITANTGYQIDFSNFTFNGQRGGFGPTSLVLRSSVDNYATNIGSVITTSSSGTNYTIDLSGTDFQNVTDITFRLYGYNAGAVGQYSVNNYQINGTVEPVVAVPEPQSLSLVGVGSVLMFGFLRRTRKEADAVA